MSKTNSNEIKVEWKDIDWRQVERYIFKLQKRIYTASLEGNVAKVRRLQRTILNSWYAKLKAVRQVTQDNSGKNTAGIDKVKSLTPKQRIELVERLEISGKAKATRRVYIPKKNGAKRPLGIPVMYDRALQCLVKLALEPEWEAKFEPNSYGFRPGRSAKDAVEAIFKSISKCDKYVLDADISKCFDKINHQVMLKKVNTFPRLRRQIKAWLKCGYMDYPSKGVYITDMGTPQGGVISPLLANIALHGMEYHIEEAMKTISGGKRGGWSRQKHKLSLIRYADDFVIIHPELEVIEFLKDKISEYLRNLGLELSTKKTKIVHTLKKHGKHEAGFSFLGFNIRQYTKGKHSSSKVKNKGTLGFKTLIKPAKESISKVYRRIAEEIEKRKSAKQSELLKKINPIIRGFRNYYNHVVSTDDLNRLDWLVTHKLHKWAKHRHKSNKGWKWIKAKYWMRIGEREIFAEDINTKLELFTDIEIKRFVKIRGSKSPFDGDWAYWTGRQGSYIGVTPSKAKLLKKQKGKCALCNLYINSDDIIETDHKIPKWKGGKDNYDNLQVVHRRCHHRKSAQETKDRVKELEEMKLNFKGCGIIERDELTLLKIEKELSGLKEELMRRETENEVYNVKEEPCEVKASSTVLKTSTNGDICA